MIEEFFLPDRARPAQENIDFPGQDFLDSMHDLGKAEVPYLRVSQWAFQMRMTWHDHSRVQLELIAVFLQAGFKDNASGFIRHFPAMVGSESNENWPLVLLDVWEPSAVVILRLHELRPR